MNVFVQPYYLWKGHFRQYADALVTEEDTLLTSKIKGPRPNSLVFFIFRVLCMLIVMVKVLFLKNKKNTNLFIIECEPLVFLIFFSVFNCFNKVSFTIHAVNKPLTGRGWKNNLYKIRSYLFFTFIKKINKIKNYQIIVHSRFHELSLREKFDSNFFLDVNVVDYPCPVPKVDRNELPSNKFLSNEILLFGAVREDKGLSDFIQSFSQASNGRYLLNVVGNISDPSVLSLSEKKILHVNFVDKFVSDDELKDMVDRAKFFIVPYARSYQGGAGPLKDAASFGLPALCTRLPLFEEVASITGYVKIFDSVDNLFHSIANIDEEEYRALSTSALTYSNENNWSNFREKYIYL